AGGATWRALVEVATQAWFHTHESQGVAPQWTIRWPGDTTRAAPVEIPPQASQMLRCDRMSAMRWLDDNGRRWQGYFMQWLPSTSLRRRYEAQFALNHPPDVCLPASGKNLIADLGVHFLTVKNLTLPMRAYEFDDRGRPLHVFR